MGNKTSSIVHNLTEGPLVKQLIFFVLPVMAGNILQSCYTIADMAIVGRLIGSDGLSAVGVGGILQSLILMVGLGLGGQIVLAQQVGADDRLRMKKVIGSFMTDRLAQSFMEGAREAEHTVTKVFLGDKKLNGCLGCNACRYGNPCVQRDDMQEIYPLVTEADTVVLSSPLYFWTISAKLKAFIERLYALAAEDRNPPLGRYERYPTRIVSCL